MSLELPASPELFLLFLCLAELFFFDDFFELLAVPVSLELDAVDPLEVPPELWANADNEKVSAMANSNVSSFFIPCLSLN